MYAVGEFSLSWNCLGFSASPPFSIILRMLKEGKKPPPLTPPPPPTPHGDTFMADTDVVAVGNDGCSFNFDRALALAPNKYFYCH